MKKSIFLLCSVLLINLANASDHLNITILYDNYVYAEGTSADWGFSCIIEGTEKTILFDAGNSGKILLDNCDLLGIDLEKIDAIVISHNHSDHTSGLNSVLERKTGIPVYFGNSFPESFSANISDKGALPIRVSESASICEDVFSTGEMQINVNEQSLVIDSEDGLVVITGCSHPGIVNIIQAAQQIVNKNVYLVFGGFHLLNHTETEADQIIQEFSAMGVLKCGATHCTGEGAIAQFKTAYGVNYIQMGTGKVIQLNKKNSATLINPVDRNSNQENEFRLSQNFPNPFYSSTTIPYSLGKPAYVNLKIINLAGKEIETLINTYQYAGEYNILWTPAGVSDGLYLYRIRTDLYTETKTLIIQN